jgi:hypothetical protein
MRESSGGGKSFIGTVETSLGLAKQRFHSLSLGFAKRSHPLLWRGRDECSGKFGAL